MREIDIRVALRSWLHSRFANDPDTRIVEELGLCQGVARVDIAAINGMLHGFEIKSEQDTLARLPSQQAIYSRVLDTVHVVAAGHHLSQIEGIVPIWWGIFEARADAGGAALSEVRAAMPNPSSDPTSVAQLLWRDEALQALTHLGLDRGVRDKPRKAIWDRLASSLSPDELGAVVRRSLKTRSEWRSDL